jgi:hypothetical protein
MHDRKIMPMNSGVSALLKGSVVLGLTLATLLICWLVPAPQTGGEAGVEMELPYHVGPLYAFSEDVTPAELYILPADTTYARKTYGLADSPRTDRILCSIILSGREKRSIHRPERCLPSQGWRIDSSQTLAVPLDSGRSLGVTALLLERPANFTNGTPFNLRSYYLYWFVGKDVTTPSNSERILMTNWDLLFHRVNQRWAYVIVSANISQDWRPDGLGPDETLAMLKQFIHDSVPSYMKSEIPDGADASSK